MNEVTPGARLAGRYRLTERTGVTPDDSVWRAVDETLDRTVTVWILRAGHPFAAQVQEAARRASLIEDRRLVTVLDVDTDSGAQGDRAFIVTEAVYGQSVEQMVAERPLTGVAARRIAGEAAEGLAAAGGRGLHHLRLTPAHVTITGTGLVKISGLAVLAASTGLDPGHATRANRTDAQALVGLLYAGLTGTWPLGDSGFRPARRGADGHPLPPNHVVRGVPADLDRLCVATFSGSGSPASPDQVAFELTPWASAAEADLVSPASADREWPAIRPVTPASGVPALAPVARLRPVIRPGGRLGGRSGGRPGPAPTARPLPAADAPAGNGTNGAAAAAGRPVARQAAARQATSRQPTASRQPSASRQAAASGQPTAGEPARRGTARPTGRGPAARFRPAPPEPPVPAEPVARVGPGLGPAPQPSVSMDDDTRPIAPLGTVAAPAPTARVAPATAPATAPAARPARPAQQSRVGRVVPVRRRDARRAEAAAGPDSGTLPRPAADAPARRRHNPPTPATGQQLMPWQGTWSDGDELPPLLESTGPFPLALPPRTPPKRQSSAVVLAMVGVVAVLVTLAVYSLRTYRFDVFGTDGSTPTVATAAPSTPKASNSPAGAAPTAQAGQGGRVKPQLAAIRAIDPQGDGDEDTANSPKAVDGDSGTSWSSQTYNSAAFGGLKKGLGLAIRLKQKTTVDSVVVHVAGTGGTVQLRLGPSSDPAAAKTVDEAGFSGGTATLHPTRDIAARYVILWFTQLPRTGDGYKAEVSEVRVT